MKKAPAKIMEVIDMGIFPAKVLFVKGFTYEEAVKELTRQKCKEWKLGISTDKELIKEGTCLALSRLIEKGKEPPIKLLYIFIPSFNFSDYDMCKLAHEVLHICQFAMPDFLDMEREFEAVAYVHTYLMRKCLKMLRGETK